jgi:X-Pro dipeptidyl-peptidase
MRNWARRLAAVAIASSALVIGATAAVGADPPQIVIGADGETAVAFGYTDAIREHVLVDSDFDSDGDGVNDLIAVDIIRPAATAQGLKVPVIMDDSPYYSTLGRGNESEKKAYDANGLVTKWPLFLDNFFVPRGYAVVLVDMTGTDKSTGCPTIQGTTDNLAGPEVIDWLNGRRTAHDSNGNLVTVDWHNGKTGMIGKSYDGALSAAAAVTGVQGLTTIVDESGPYNYYDYTRTNGIVQRGNHYLAGNSSSLAFTITTDSPARQTHCQPTWNAIAAQDGDSTGDYSPFWEPRNYVKDADKVRASVFAVHGLADENVRIDHFGKWWAALAANNVPRKAWLSQEGHVDPFDFRRAAWVDTVHRWFDYWLQDVPNGIMSEPRVTIETSKDVFSDYADWPLPGTAMQTVYLRSGATATAAGSLALSSGGALASRTFTDNNSSENSYINTPAGSQTNRLVFVSPPLTHDLRLSGTPTVEIQASSSNRTQTNLTAFLVDYGSGTYVTRTNDGVSTAANAPETCWGLSSPTDDPCYKEITKNTTTVTTWRVTKGMLDSSNRDSLTTPTPMTLGTKYTFRWPLLPNDFTFKAGHQIGVVLGANFSGYGTTNGMTGAVITVDTKTAKINLPLVGGYGAARDSGAFAADTTGPTLNLPGTVTKEATGPTTPVTYTATATDDEDPNPTVSCSPASGTSFPVDSTTVSCTATDASGNATQGSFTVLVTDTTAPSIDPHGDVTAEATSPQGAVVSYDSPATHDAVDGDGTASCTPPSGSQFAKGQTTVTCTALDHHGNSTSSSFRVFVVDTTAPTTSATVSPASPDGLNGWYVTNPLITLTATDTASPVTRTQYYIGPDPNWVDYNGPFNMCSAAVPCGPHWIHWASTDAAGNTEATKSITLSADLADPVTAAALSPAIHNGWYASPTLTLTADDGPTGSGIAHTDYSLDGGAWQAYSGPVSGFSTGNHFVQYRSTDVAGRQEAVKLIAFKADSVKPTVTVTTPADGASYPLDKAVATKFKCTDNESGIDTCAASAATLDTSTVGDHTLTVTGTDKAGNVTVVTRHYQVTYTWNGFFAPVSNTETSTLNLVHAGDLVKVGFGLNGDRGLAVFAAGSPTSVAIPCPSWTPHSVPAAGAGSTAGLSYGVASGHYTYGWQTDGGWAGTCRRFELQLNDGTPTLHSADFMFFA